MSIITTNLRNACSHDALNCRTVTRWFKRFQDRRRLMGYNARTVCRSTPVDNASIEILTNDGVVDGSGVGYAKNNIPHFNQTFDEEKCCGTMGAAHAVFHTKIMSYGTV